MKKYKNYYSCSACGTKFDLLQQNCPNCGIKASEKMIIHVCLKCGKRIDEHVKLCESCSKKIKNLNVNNASKNRSINDSNKKDNIKEDFSFSKTNGFDIFLYVIGGIIITALLDTGFKTLFDLYFFLFGVSLLKILYELFSKYIFRLNNKSIKFFRIFLPILFFFAMCCNPDSETNDSSDSLISSDSVEQTD